MSKRNGQKHLPTYWSDETSVPMSNNYQELNQPLLTKKHPTYPRAARSIILNIVNRDFFSDLLEGLGVKDVESFMVGEKLVTRERLNHILSSAGMKVAGIED